MEFDTIKNNLDILHKQGSEFRCELERQAKDRGLNSRPLKSHKGPDTVELNIERRFESLHNNTLSAYNTAVICIRSGVHPDLIKLDIKLRENSDSNNDLNLEDPTITFSAIMENHRSALSDTGSKANDAIENLIQFKKENKLERNAEYPDNRKNIFWTIGGVLLLIGIFAFGLLYSQESDSSTRGFIGTVFLILLVNSVCGYFSAEAFRASKHSNEALRTSSKIVISALIVSAIAFNLGIGHYRDALVPSYPPPETNETNNYEISETQNESTQNLSENNNSIPTQSSPGQDAIILLFSRFILLNDLFSYILTISGVIFFSTIFWLVWRNDDAYFMYGWKTRQCKRNFNQWNSERDKVLNQLQIQHEHINNNLQESRIDFVEKRNLILTNYDQFFTIANDLITEIKNAFGDSIQMYRTTNIEVRPLQTPPPPHWLEPWESNWSKLTQATTDFLCSQEDAHNLTQRRERTIGEHISILEEKYQEFRDEVFGFGPTKILEESFD